MSLGNLVFFIYEIILIYDEQYDSFHVLTSLRFINNIRLDNVNKVDETKSNNFHNYHRQNCHLTE